MFGAVECVPFDCLLVTHPRAGSSRGPGRRHPPGQLPDQVLDVRQRPVPELVNPPHLHGQRQPLCGRTARNVKAERGFAPLLPTGQRQRI